MSASNYPITANSVTSAKAAIFPQPVARGTDSSFEKDFSVRGVYRCRHIMAVLLSSPPPNKNSNTIFFLFVSMRLTLKYCNDWSSVVICISEEGQLGAL